MTDSAPDKIFSFLEKELPKLHNKKISGLSSYSKATSGSGSIVEDWLLDQLKNTKNSPFRALSTVEFLTELFNCIQVKNKIGKEQLAEIQNTWWFSAFATVKTHMKSYANEKPLEASQQDGADMVLFYGKNIVEDMNKLIIINAKSHNKTKKSQAPNIVSVERLVANQLAIIDNFPLDKEKQNKLFSYRKYWIIAIDYIPVSDSSSESLVSHIHLKDLYKTDGRKIYINFAAALQLQKHPHDMPQIKSQSSNKFINDLLANLMINYSARINKKLQEYKENYQKITGKKYSN